MKFPITLLTILATILPAMVGAQDFSNLPRPGRATQPQPNAAPAAVQAQPPAYAAPANTTAAPAVTTAANNPFLRQRAAPSEAPSGGFIAAPTQPNIAPAMQPGFSPGFSNLAPGFSQPAIAGTTPAAEPEVEEEHPVKKSGKLLGTVNGRAVYKANTYYFDKPGVAPKVPENVQVQTATAPAPSKNANAPRR